MNTAAHDAVNIPKGPGGPKTEQGKANSSRNAIRTGLYAARDFVRPGEEAEYAETLIKLMDELTPEGTLEQTFATEIMGATWRLRRCRLVEEAFGSVEDLDFDPMMDERTEKKQKSVDRARAQSHLILRRSIAELSKLQTARTIREQLNAQDIPGLTDIKKAASTLKMEGLAPDTAKPDPAPTPAAAENVPAGLDALMALADKQLAQRYRESGLSSFCVGQVSESSFCKPTPTTPAAPAAPKPAEPASHQKTSAQTPRNAPCPCKSGQKYKRCCGKEAPPVLNKAA